VLETGTDEGCDFKRLNSPLLPTPVLRWPSTSLIEGWQPANSTALVLVIAVAPAAFLSAARAICWYRSRSKKSTRQICRDFRWVGIHWKQLTAPIHL